MAPLWLVLFLNFLHSFHSCNITIITLIVGLPFTNKLILICEPLNQIWGVCRLLIFHFFFFFFFFVWWRYWRTLSPIFLILKNLQKYYFNPLTSALEYYNIRISWKCAVNFIFFFSFTLPLTHTNVSDHSTGNFVLLLMKLFKFDAFDYFKKNYELKLMLIYVILTQISNEILLAN